MRIDNTNILIDIEKNVDLKSAIRTFSKVAKMVHGREEIRKSGRKSRGPFLLEGKR